jgi:acetyl-CoA C-acetyltransferase
MNKNIHKAGLKKSDIGVWEINEAFAVVALMAIESLKLNYDRVNINGGAIALGHPIGVSGTRIILTLMENMKRLDERFGLASICIGGGEALSIIIEKLK